LLAHIQLKKVFLVLIACFLCFAASAQYNYYRLSLGGGVGGALAFGDLKKNYIRPAGMATLDYNISPFAQAGIEIQKGIMKGGDSTNISIDPHLRSFTNSYMSVILSGKVQLGQFVDFESSNLLYAIRGFYVGTGVGYLMNNMTEVTRVKPDGTKYIFPGVNKGSEIMIPINTGISFNFVDKWRFTKLSVNFNYQLNKVFGESLDGYNDPPSKFKNQYGDFYSLVSVGVRYHFGPEGLY
jgi:hypothetical protein